MIDWQTVDKTKIDPELLQRLEDFAEALASPVTILSGFRSTSEFSGSLHLTGRAVDFYTPAGPGRVRELAEKYFNGVGVYLNEKNIVTWHVDNRDRSASWGAFILPGPSGAREYTYTTFAEVWKKLSDAKSYILPLFVLAVLLVFLGRVK